MKSKTKAWAMILIGVFLLSSLEVLQAQSTVSDEPVVRTTTSRTPTTSQPAVRPTATRTTATRPTPARPVAVSRTARTSPRATTRRMPRMPIRPQGDLIASGLLKVVCDESILELNDQILGAIVNSSFVLPEEAQEALTIEVQSLGNTRGQNLFQLEIFENPEPEDVSHGEYGAKEDELTALEIPGEEEEKEGEDFQDLPPVQMISEIADRLKDILMAEYNKQQRQIFNKLAEAEAELKPLEEKMRRLNDHERELYAKAGTSSLRRNDVLKQIQSLERKRQDMEMRLVEAAAREEALQKQIAILGDQTEKKLTQDSVLEELVNILKLREEEMKTVEKMVETGRTSQSEYLKAREAIAQARIELVKRQEAIRDSTGGGATLQERVKELTDIAILNAESQAVLKHISEQLAMLKAKKILELADQYEVEIALKQDFMRRSYEYAQKNIQSYKFDMQRTLAPSVSVLGGN
jgi:hypothetical protein